MASQKVRPAVLQQFFRTSTYDMYAFIPEKLLRLVGRNFCLAIWRAFSKDQIFSVGWRRGSVRFLTLVKDRTARVEDNFRYLVSIRKRPFSPISASICTFACAA
jgi:hypothetical protein